MMVFGDLELPRPALKPYLARTIDPALRDDWLGNLSIHVTSAPRTAGALLPSLPDAVSERAGSWLVQRLDESIARLEVRGILGEDDFDDLGVQLAELFRVGGELGGRGELWFLEEQVMMLGEQQPDLCYLVKASPKGTTIRHPTRADQRRAMSTEGFQEVIERVAASLDEETRASLRLGTTPGKPNAPPRGTKKPAKPKKR